MHKSTFHPHTHAFSTDVAKTKNQSFDLKWMTRGELATKWPTEKSRCHWRATRRAFKYHVYISPLTTKLQSRKTGRSHTLCKELQWLANSEKIGVPETGLHVRTSHSMCSASQKQRPLWRVHQKAHCINFSSLSWCYQVQTHVNPSNGILMKKTNGRVEPIQV